MPKKTEVIETPPAETGGFAEYQCGCATEEEAKKEGDE